MGYRYQYLGIQFSNGVLTVTLQRPEALNALNSHLLDEFDDLIRRVEDDSDVGVVVVTGSGEKAFCAGADLAELQNLTVEAARQYLRKGQRIFRRLEHLNKPSIAAINGYALGGGLELALACSIRYASSNAKLGFPEVRLGMIPGYGGTQRLTRLVGKGRGLEMLLTGRQISADEAWNYGLVNAVKDREDLLPSVYQLAEEILQNSLQAVSNVLQAVTFGIEMHLSDALEWETLLDAVSAASEDQKRRVADFLLKRKK